MSRTLIALACLLAATCASAREATLAVRDRARARAAWSELQSVRDESDPPGGIERSPAESERLAKRFAKARWKLLRALSPERWLAFEPEAEDEEHLEEALVLLASESLESDPTTAAAACERHERLFPDSPMSAQVRSWILPSALLLQAPELAQARLFDLRARVPAREQPLVDLARVDALALGGVLDAARALAADVLGDARDRDDLFPAKQWIVYGAGIRSRLLGRKLGTLHPKLRLGSEPRASRRDTPRVTVVAFWEPWCAPCVAEMPHLSRLQARLARRGLGVLGVTRGRMASGTSQVMDDLDAARARELAEFVAFVERREPGYPIVVVDEPYFEEHGVEGIPVTLLVDGRGTIRLALTVSGQVTLLDSAARRMLASPSEPEVRSAAAASPRSMSRR